ncbi:unnamed protein product [Allacma fusca]|uniref:BZIP domain-containing protein n=1 Tax=Allacma fusca TaxID=39272 RepID=A0A8J2KP05_9HEXA|nr:unnamed protein product [Allacma fusca]
MFFSSNGSSKGNESQYSSQQTLDQSLNLSQSSLDDQDCDDDLDSSMLGENGKRILGHRNQKRPIPNEQKDGKYFERRRRNNLAAKKSRDARKTREDQLAMRVAHLEKENAIFRAQVAIYREEMSVLQLILCQKANGNFKSETNG